jgi:pyrroline-5-carboxylate reductase
MIERDIGFIGAGTMAQALLDGMLASGTASPENLFAADPSEERRELFAERIGRNVFDDNSELVERVDAVVLAVKPHVVPRVADEVDIGADRLLVSIAAGVSLERLAALFGTRRVVRVMPNTPALVGEGAAAYCLGQDAGQEDGALVADMLSAVGLAEWVDEEQMDAVTGLSGSGPAYIYMAIEALSDGAVKMGLGRTEATRLAAQTVLGAARMVLETGEHPGRLKDKVTTPGGTTIEAVHALEAGGMRNAFISAVQAATEKSRRLSERSRQAEQ